MRDFRYARHRGWRPHIDARRNVFERTPCRIPALFRRQTAFRVFGVKAEDAVVLLNIPLIHILLPVLIADLAVDVICPRLSTVHKYNSCEKIKEKIMDFMS